MLGWAKARLPFRVGVHVVLPLFVIADHVKDICEDRDAIAVRVVQGQPKNIVVVIKFPDLSEVDDEVRQDYLTGIGELLDEQAILSHAAPRS